MISYMKENSLFEFMVTSKKFPIGNSILEYRQERICRRKLYVSYSKNDKYESYDLFNQIILTSFVQSII